MTTYDGTVVGPLDGGDPALGATRAAPIRFVLGIALVMTMILVGCTAAPAVDTPSTGTTSPTAPTSSSIPSIPSTTPTGTATPRIDPDPTYFTPTDAASYSLTGHIAVEQARQDPFSNLLRRGALHGQPVTLDVVGTPDYAVSYGRPAEILFGTCRCATRGQGLRVTVEDGAAVRDGGAGTVRIVGRFTATVTAQDAITLVSVR